MDKEGEEDAEDDYIDNFTLTISYRSQTLSFILLRNVEYDVFLVFLYV